MLLLPDATMEMGLNGIQHAARLYQLFAEPSFSKACQSQQGISVRQFLRFEAARLESEMNSYGPWAVEMVLLNVLPLMIWIDGII